uniref:Uncharacterized protein n=1 Tax=Lactuca sativa TaxID=4236 RepID=A0A9R1VD09_LACSA|nr:hypothetical protein LSAT_V11C600341060 [Lactuca sativa]
MVSDTLDLPTYSCDAVELRQGISQFGSYSIFQIDSLSSNPSFDQALSSWRLTYLSCDFTRHHFFNFLIERFDYTCESLYRVFISSS